MKTSAIYTAGMDHPVLVVVAGRPGTGKTTLATVLVPAPGPPYLRMDAIVIPLLRGGLTDDEAGAARAAYEVAHELAAENLRAGMAVVVDGLNPTHEGRAAWREIAEGARASLVLLETIVCDPREHRRRVDQRRRRSSGYVGPSWKSIGAQAYDPWDENCYGPRLVVDMTDARDALSVALSHIGDLRIR